MKQNGMRERKGRISRYGRRMLAVLLSAGMLLTGTLPVSGTENTEETARPHQLYCTVLGDSIAKGYTCDKSWMENYGSLAAKEIAYSEGRGISRGVEPSTNKQRRLYKYARPPDQRKRSEQ